MIFLKYGYYGNAFFFRQCEQIDEEDFWIFKLPNPIIQQL